MRKVFLICGPTASGKSQLALQIAQHLDAHIVNADALQVYSNWRALTARPDEQDCQAAPHQLYGHIGPEQNYSVGHWLKDVTTILESSANVVFVGGTGLYFTALTQGLNDIPATLEETRQKSEAFFAAHGLEGLQDFVAQTDPTLHARVDLNNARRLQRAWEVYHQTGRPLSEWQASPTAPLLDEASAIRLILQPETTRLNARIRERLGQMVNDGALEECARNVNLDPSRPAAKALGADAFRAHLRGEISLDDALDRAAIATRQFAKRQRTWIRSRFSHWTHLETPDIDKVLSLAKGLGH